MWVIPGTTANKPSEDENEPAGELCVQPRTAYVARPASAKPTSTRPFEESSSSQRGSQREQRQRQQQPLRQPRRVQQRPASATTPQRSVTGTPPRGATDATAHLMAMREARTYDSYSSSVLWKPAPLAATPTTRALHAAHRSFTHSQRMARGLSPGESIRQPNLTIASHWGNSRAVVAFPSASHTDDGSASHGDGPSTPHAHLSASRSHGHPVAATSRDDDVSRADDVDRADVLAAVISAAAPPAPALLAKPDAAKSSQVLSAAPAPVPPWGHGGSHGGGHGWGHGCCHMAAMDADGSCCPRKLPPSASTLLGSAGRKPMARVASAPLIRPRRSLVDSRPSTLTLDPRSDPHPLVGPGDRVEPSGSRVQGTGSGGCASGERTSGGSRVQGGAPGSRCGSSTHLAAAAPGLLTAPAPGLLLDAQDGHRVQGTIGGSRPAPGLLLDAQDGVRSDAGMAVIHHGDEVHGPGGRGQRSAPLAQASGPPAGMCGPRAQGPAGMRCALAPGCGCGGSGLLAGHSPPFMPPDMPPELLAHGPRPTGQGPRSIAELVAVGGGVDEALRGVAHSLLHAGPLPFEPEASPTASCMQVRSHSNQRRRPQPLACRSAPIRTKGVAHSLLHAGPLPFEPWVHAWRACLT